MPVDGDDNGIRLSMRRGSDADHKDDNLGPTSSGNTGRNADRTLRVVFPKLGNGTTDTTSALTYGLVIPPSYLAMCTIPRPRVRGHHTFGIFASHWIMNLFE